MKTKILATFLFLAVGSIFAETPQFYIGGRVGMGPIFGSDGTVLGGNTFAVNIG